MNKKEYKLCSEEHISTLREKGIVIIPTLLPQKELGITYRRGKEDNLSPLHTLVDAFDPEVLGVSGQGHHVGSFAVEHHYIYSPQRDIYVAAPAALVPHQLPFSPQAANYFGRNGFPEEYADPPRFEKLRRHTSRDKNRVVNFFDGEKSKPQYADEFAAEFAESRSYKLGSYKSGDVMLLGSGESHPLWVASSYQNLEKALVSLTLHLLAGDSGVLGFVAAYFDERPVSFWMQFGATLVEESVAAIPFSGSAEEVVKQYHSSNSDDF